MLYRTHVISALEERREEFVTFGRALVEDVLASARRLRALGGRTAADVKRESGALAARISFPSDELDGAGGVVVRFDRRWRSHEEARRWALEVLRGRVTFAADGSQVFPGREASVPVAAVQVASFENPHSAEGRYLKDVHFEVITPAHTKAPTRSSARAASSWRRRPSESFWRSGAAGVRGASACPSPSSTTRSSSLRGARMRKSSSRRATPPRSSS
jgi:hypothetical protein